MEVGGKKVLVTGGAGFIGSHLVDRLVDLAAETIVLDNLSSGTMDNMKRAIVKQNFRFVKGDLLDVNAICETLADCSIVFHLAANSEVRVGSLDPRIDFQQNLLATHNLLEAMRASKNAKHIAFASTSTVYGEPAVIPTPENSSTVRPISSYGASKIGCEALISAYCHLFDMNAVVCRFANVVGLRSKHGVVYDFIEKLKKNLYRLEALGDGTQSKSYMLVDDCVEGLLFAVQHADSRVRILNIGSEDRVDVRTIAEIVIEEMGLSNVQLTFTGGVEGRGWPGDVRVMQLDIGEIRSLGWEPKHNSIESIRLATRSILREMSSKVVH